MGLENQQDQDLLNEIRQGNKNSFRSLFDRYYEGLVISAMQFLKDRDASKDAVQEVFYQIWKNRDKLSINQSLGGYLKRAVINRCLNQIKSRKAFVEEEKLQFHANKEPSPQHILEAEDVQDAVQKGLDSLPDRCRTIFILKRIEGYSLKEIAEKLDISPKTVEHQMTKALKVLKAVVAPLIQKNTS